MRFLVVKAPCQSCERVSCKTLPHPDDSSIDRWMLLLSALLMPCTPFRIGPTSIERELAELEQAAERAGLDGVRWPSHNSCYEVVMLAVIKTSGRCYACYEVL